MARWPSSMGSRVPLSKGPLAPDCNIFADVFGIIFHPVFEDSFFPIIYTRPSASGAKLVLLLTAEVDLARGNFSSFVVVSKVTQPLVGIRRQLIVILVERTIAVHFKVIIM
jgi:hypothetical protein